MIGQAEEGTSGCAPAGLTPLRIVIADRARALPEAPPLNKCGGSQKGISPGYQHVRVRGSRSTNQREHAYVISMALIGQDSQPALRRNEVELMQQHTIHMIAARSASAALAGCRPLTE